MNRRLVLALGALALLASCAACSPVYVVKAGVAEIGILRARQPIHRVLNDPATDEATRGKLAYVLEARRFAGDELGIDVGDSYTMFTQLQRDTLVLVVSAARKDALVPRTWWFPIVGRVPYKGYFSERDALRSAASLAADGWDTYVRPAGAFSTLGWFNDPLLSTVLRADDVDVVETVLHELSHQHLFVPGHVGFNESFGTFVGRVAAARFFCTREGGGPDTVRCQRAEARWRDVQRFSVFIDELVNELQSVYQRSDISPDTKVARRDDIFERALERFDTEIQPTFEQYTFQSFRDTPLNNATLLARMRYYHRLPDFAAYLEARDGDLRRTLEDLKANARSVADPFDLLPRGSSAPTLSAEVATAG